MSLDNYIREWVHLDNKLKELSKQQQDIREKHNSLSETIIDIVKTRHNNIRIIKISDGLLNLSNINCYQSLTYNYLKTVLNKYFLDSDDNQTDKILEFIKANRLVESKTVLKRTYNK